MNLLPLIERLADDKVGVKAKTLFVNMIPANAPQGVLLRNPLTGTPINYEMRGYFRTEFNLIARAGSYEAGEALVQKAIKSLTLPAGTELGGMKFQYCRPRTEPSAFPLSKGNLLEFAVDFDVCFAVVQP